MRRAAIELALSSGFAALAAVLAGGTVEMVRDASGPLGGVAAIGFLAVLAVPLGFTASVAGRLLVRGWRPGDLVGRLRDPATGGAPRLAAWALYLLAAAVALAAIVLQGMNAVTGRSSARVVHVLAAPMLAVGGAAALASLARPAVGGLTRLLTPVDRAVHRRAGRSAFHPVWIAGGTLAVASGLLALAWTASIRPHVGHIDLGFLPQGIVWLTTLGLAPLGWAALGARRRARAAALAVAAVLVLTAMGAAIWLRYQRPLVMLSIWGDSQLTGFAIDRLYDIEELRGELNLAFVAPQARPGAPHHDIVLITVDTLRADRTPAYGGPARMPALATLGQQAAVFEWAFSPGNVTRRSLPSMAIGVTAPRLRGRVAGWALKLDPRHILLAERLRAGGYDTAGFFCCTSQFGAEHKLGLIRGIEHVEIDKDSEELARRAAAWLAAREQRAHAGSQRRPMFVWFHFIEPHGWQKAHPRSAEVRTNRQRYDLTLADVDVAIGAVLDQFWRPPTRRDRTYLILTSDHGEALGDHGHRTHASSLYSAETHVPLLVAGPGIAPRRIGRTVGLHDLAPTLLDLAGFVPPGLPAMDGVSLAPVARGEAPGERDTGEAYMAMIEDRSVSTERRAIVVGRHKLIWRTGSSEVELYDLARDPGEMNDLAATRPELVEQLRARLEARRALDHVDPF